MKIWILKPWNHSDDNQKSKKYQTQKKNWNLRKCWKSRISYSLTTAQTECPEKSSTPPGKVLNDDSFNVDLESEFCENFGDNTSLNDKPKSS